jgi:hypothetical protein
MRSITLLFTALAVVLVTVGGAQAGSSQAPKFTVLDDGASQLRDDFNYARGSVRLLFVVDPICAGCLSGLGEMNKALLAGTRHPRLQAFVVYVPVLHPSATAQDVPRAAALLHNPHVHNYWNPSGAFGRTLAEAVGLKHDGKPVYAWDVWLIYGPDATWTSSGPPMPRLLMHQLWALEHSSFPHLDAKAYAREVHQLLAKLPPEQRTS